MNYRLDADTLRRAFLGVSIYLSLTLLGVLILAAHGSSLSYSTLECLSAIGTVGLTTANT